MKAIAIFIFTVALFANHSAFAKSGSWFLRMNGGGGSDWVREFPSQAICEKEKKKFLMMLKKAKTTYPGYARCVSFNPLS
jgi:hypothetical protein